VVYPESRPRSKAKEGGQGREEEESMSEPTLIERANKYLSQLAPHIRKREAASLIESLTAELTTLSKGMDLLKEHPYEKRIESLTND
jgi:hypothetical protein